MINTFGSIKIKNREYKIYCKFYADKTEYVVLNPYCNEDIKRGSIGLETIYGQISTARDLFRDNINDYIVEYYIHNFKVPDRKFGKETIVEEMLKYIGEASAYEFEEDEIIVDSVEIIDDKHEKKFSAGNELLVYSYYMIENQYINLKLESSILRLQFEKVTTNVKFNCDTYLVTDEIAKHVEELTVSKINMTDLMATSDMSWYIKNGVKQKNYRAIESINEFEEFCMTPLIIAIQKSSKEDPLIIGFDTETTGLQFFNVSSKDHIVSIQLSWEDNQGVIIFLDMEYFNNVPTQYVLSRLESIFKKNAESTFLYDNKKREFVTLDRLTYLLTPHNGMFDKKVIYSEGYSFYVDDDTLQMAFNLDPKGVRDSAKGANKLKNLTRRIFGHETPELTDILGARNADKFRMLTDKEVATVYGCADTDYARMLHKYLKKLMGSQLYESYKKQDSLLENVLAVSEYYGLNADIDSVIKLGNEVKENIEILEDFVQHYVGAILDIKQQAFELKTKLDLNEISQEEFNEAVNNITIDNSAVYTFKFTPANLSNVIYNILNYKKIAFSENDPTKPKLDKYVLKKLDAIEKSPNSHVRGIKEDVLKSGCSRTEYNKLRSLGKEYKKQADDMVLISAKEFNEKEYPLASVLLLRSTLNKEFTSYFKPIMNNNTEGKMFYHYNMARIETRRIANPGQTMKGKLKKLIKPYNDDYYLLDFDMSQAEYRVMISLAGYSELIERMRDPEKDYHTETASAVHGIPAYKVTKDIRKHTKCLGFGIPYGLGKNSLCESMFGSINTKNLIETDLLLAKWQKGNAPVMDLLNRSRDRALTEWEISDEFRNYIGAWKKKKMINAKGKEVVVKDSLGRPIYELDENGDKIPEPISRVASEYGFYRTFDISKVGQTAEDKQRRSEGKYNAVESTIRRAAGNYGIQEYAAEMFRLILMRFYNSCEDVGYHHGDKIIWHMLIHDELLCSVHKSIHPFEIYKLVKQACMITKKNHTNYFVGINIGETWGECKDDAREAPVLMVQDIVNRWNSGEFSLENTPDNFKKDGHYWFDHPMDFIQPYMDEFHKNRIYTELKKIQPDIDTKPINVPLILENFDNYTVRAYVSSYKQYNSVNDDDFIIATKTTGEPVYDQDKISDAKWMQSLLTWAKEYYGHERDYIDVNNKLSSMNSQVRKSSVFTIVDFTDDVNVNDEDNMQDIFEDIIEDDLDFYFGSIDSENYDSEEYKESEKTHRYVNLIHNQVFISVNDRNMLLKVKEYLKPYESNKGYLTQFKIGSNLLRGSFVNVNIPIDDLDLYIEKLNQEVVCS